MQGQYSLTYREEEREMIGYCKAFGIGLIPWGPLAAGQLARPWSTTQSGTTRTAADAKMPWATDAEAHEKAIVQRVEEVAGKKGWTMGQVALAWIGGKVTSPIIGFSSVKRMEEAIIPGYKLTEEEVKYLEEPCVRLPRWHCPRLTRLQIPPYGRPRARVSAPSLPICTNRCNTCRRRELRKAIGARRAAVTQPEHGARHDSYPPAASDAHGAHGTDRLPPPAFDDSPFWIWAGRRRLVARRRRPSARARRDRTPRQAQSPPELWRARRAPHI
jgi:hypothetical protein